MKTAKKSSFKNLQKQLPFREIYVKYLRKAVAIVYSYITYLYPVLMCYEIINVSNKHLIHW